MDDRTKKDVFDAKVAKEMFQCSDNCPVMTRIFCKGLMRGYGNKYMSRATEEVWEVREGIWKKLEVDEVYGTSEKVVIRTATEVVEHKKQKGVRKGNVWWTNKVKNTVIKVSFTFLLPVILESLKITPWVTWQIWCQ